MVYNDSHKICSVVTFISVYPHAKFPMIPASSNVKAVFHFIISPPPAKNFDIEIIFLRSCVAEDTCSAGPVVENFHLLFDLTLTARKNN